MLLHILCKYQVNDIQLAGTLLLSWHVGACGSHISMKLLLKILPMHHAYCFLKHASFMLEVIALKNGLMNKKG